MGNTLSPAGHENRLFKRDRITLVALLNEEKGIEELRLFPATNFDGNSIRLYNHTEFFRRGTRLENISDFLNGLEQVRKAVTLAPLRSD